MISFRALLRLFYGSGTVVCVTIALGLLPSVAQGSVPIFKFSTLPSTTKAGAHPDVDFLFEVGNRQQNPSPCACHDSRNVTVHLPTGLIGSTSSTPKCTIAQFSARQCPTDSQLGVSEDKFSDSPGERGGLGEGLFLSPVYNLVPPPEQPALLAFEAGLVNTPVFINVSARTDSDYGVDATVSNIDHFVPLHFSQTIIWGVPAASVHDYLRFHFGQEAEVALSSSSFSVMCSANGTAVFGDPADAYQFCRQHEGHEEIYGAIGNVPEQGFFFPEGVPSNSPENPFFQNPTTCGETFLATSLDILAYDGGKSHADSPYPPTTECSQLSFNPSQAISPTTTAADSPSGAEFRLTVPQFESPSVPSPSELKAANVTLPAGFALAPNVMNGKTTCSEAESRYGTTEEAHCPENSKIGTISVETPVLPGVLPGAVYLGEPKPGDRFRMILAFDGFGVHVKLPGSLIPDPQTGQIQIDFQNLPQAPFAYFNAHFFGSERGSLATPTQCGTYEVSSEWTPWDSALSNQISRQFFEINEGPSGAPCPNGPRPFHPGFQAAAATNTAAAHTSFSVNLTRSDGDQNLAALAVTTPPGFSATLKDVPYCPQSALDQLASPLYPGISELAFPLCTSSQVGTVTTGVGAGSHPLYLPGKAYLAGPYKGAPLSLLVVIPAVSGPYDLGDVVIRSALRVNPETAQVTTVSDPLPPIVGGIPVRTRQVLVNLDRPDFALNPTDCDPLSVDATLSGDEGAASDLSQHFQVANCASLPFAPKFSLKLTGGLHRLGHPAIHALLRAQPGEANPSAISVTLPPNELLDNGHIVAVCTGVDFAAQSCPPGSLLGHAEVTTPLLDQPLQGSAYLRSSGQGLPDLALDLYGQLHIEAVARIDAVNGGLRTTFHTVPDVPLGSVSLDLKGGSKGLVQNSEPLCGGHFKAAVKMTGQNGKALTRKVPLQTACGKPARHKRGGGRR